MDFKDFIHLNEKTNEHKFTVKVACDVMDKGLLAMVEQGLSRLDVTSIDKKAISSPLLENPLDFPNIRNTSVHTFDIAVKYPVTTDALELAISESLGIKRGLVVVYSENDPRKKYTEEVIARCDPEFKEDYVPCLGAEEVPAEEHKLFGDAYNVPFLDYLRKKREDKDDTTVINALSPKQTFDSAGVMKTKKEDSSPALSPLSKVNRPITRS